MRRRLCPPCGAVGFHKKSKLEFVLVNFLPVWDGERRGACPREGLKSKKYKKKAVCCSGGGGTVCVHGAGVGKPLTLGSSVATASTACTTSGQRESLARYKVPPASAELRGHTVPKCDAGAATRPCLGARRDHIQPANRLRATKPSPRNTTTTTTAAKMRSSWRQRSAPQQPSAHNHPHPFLERADTNGSARQRQRSFGLAEPCNG